MWWPNTGVLTRDSGAGALFEQSLRVLLTVISYLGCKHWSLVILLLQQSVSFQHSSNLGCPYSVCCRLSKWPLNKSWKTMFLSSLPTSWSVWCHRSIIRNANVNESITILQWSLICIFYVCSVVTVMAEAIKMSDKRGRISTKVKTSYKFWILASNFKCHISWCFLKETWMQFFVFL